MLIDVAAVFTIHCHGNYLRHHHLEAIYTQPLVGTVYLTHL
jgi:hypothetical protein